MTRTYFAWMLTAMLAAPTLAQEKNAEPAQRENPQFREAELLHQQAVLAQTEAALLDQQAAARQSQRRMDIDVEVLRRLLDEKVHSMQPTAQQPSVLWPQELGDATTASDYLSQALAFSPDGKTLHSQYGDYVHFYDAATGKAFVNDWVARVDQPAAARRAFEGVHLPGHGVVFTATLPAARVLFDPHSGRDVFDHKQCATCHQDALPVEDAAQIFPRASRWEQLRRELTGEGDTPQETEATAERVRKTKTRKAASTSVNDDARSLAASLAKVLADNGRHLAELNDDDRITLAVTLEPRREAVRKRVMNEWYGTTGGTDPNAPSIGGSGSASAADSSSGGASNNPSAPAADDAPAKQPSAAADQSPAKGGAPTLLGVLTDASVYRSAGDEGGAPSTLRDYVLLGDLHEKQGKSEEAMRAYQDAILILDDGVVVSFPQDAPHDRVQESLRKIEQDVIQLHAKLARVQAMLGRNQEARDTLKKAAAGLTRLKVRVGEEVVDVEVQDAAVKVASAAKKSAARLPVKLIVSAPKKLLIEVSEGKISSEEFQRQVSVEVRGLEQDAAGGEPAPATGR